MLGKGFEHQLTHTSPEEKLCSSVRCTRSFVGTHVRSETLGLRQLKCAYAFKITAASTSDNLSTSSINSFADHGMVS